MLRKSLAINLLGGTTIFLIILCLAVISAWATSPPQDNKSYRGDMDGDFVASLPDLNAARDRSLLKPFDYSAVVPGDLTKGDTADISGDGVVDLIDLNALRDVSLLRNYATPDTPWILDTSGIPAIITGSGSIQAAVTNISGIGRPGIVVSFSISAGPATLTGREYNPVDDNIRDHASLPGATQVLAITTTDFPGDQTGATELTIPNVGTPVELVCTGTGAVTVDVDVLADALKGIPSLSQSVGVSCSFGNIWYVDITATGANNGTSWTDAYKVIQDGIDAASSGDWIWVAEGTYTSINAQVVTMKDGVGIYGGFVGTESLLSERPDPSLNPSVIDGEGVRRGMLGANSNILDGFSLINGYFNGPGAGFYSYNNEGVDINNLIFGYNYTSGATGANGGAFYIKNMLSNSTISNSVFSSNYALIGGGIFSNNSDTTISHSIFKHGIAYIGGGIALSRGSVSISNSVFEFNTADYIGGGVFNYDGITTISNSTFAYNYSWLPGASVATDLYSYGPSTTVISNSIMWGGNTFEIYFGSYDTGSMTVSYSDIEGGYTGVGNINNDPLFIDGANGNVHLQPTSPAIDKGNPAAIYNDPDGSRNDMGAYGGQTAWFDTDYDGMEDWWEDLMGLDKDDPADALGNPDGDTFTNVVEFTYQTDPFTSDIRFVDASAPAGGDGLSWVTAYQHPQDALDVSSTPKVVLVAGGTYYSGTTGPVLALEDNFSFYGGCAGTESLPADRGDPSLSPAILDGENLSLSVVIGAHDIIFDGFTVTRGNGASRGSGFNGGRKTNLTIANCVFEDNLNAGKGGGIYFEGDNLSITNCVFTGNSAGNSGGAVAISYADNVSITGCTFNGNMVTSVESSGGAISFVNSKSVTTENCVFNNNSSNKIAGAIYKLSYAGTFKNCLFSGNSALYGGAFANTLSSPTITNCTFSGNSATIKGGAIRNYNCSPIIINTVVWGNTAPAGPHILHEGSGSTTVDYSDVQGGFAGTNNIDVDPLFVAGPSGNYYLNQASSQCVNTGSDTAVNLGMDIYTTDPLSTPDTGVVDMGYHYEIP